MSEDTTLDQSLVNEQQSDKTQENPSSENVGQLIYEAKKHRQDKAKLREELDSLKSNISQNDELELKKKEEYKALSERLSQERDEYKLKADEFDTFQEEFRSNLIDTLSDEQKEIVTDLPLNKLSYDPDRILEAISKFCDPDEMAERKN